MDGRITRLVNKGFGFIERADTGDEYFFHMSTLRGTEFEDLREGQQVTFEEGTSAVGPRAERVALA